MPQLCPTELRTNLSYTRDYILIANFIAMVNIARIIVIAMVNIANVIVIAMVNIVIVIVIATVNIVMVNIIRVNLVIDYIFIANFIATVNIVITVSTKFWFLVCNVDDRPFHNHQLHLPISISIFTSYSPPTHTFTIQRTTQHFQDIVIFIYLIFSCQIYFPTKHKMTPT